MNFLSISISFKSTIILIIFVVILHLILSMYVQLITSNERVYDRTLCLTHTRKENITYDKAEQNN